MNVPTTLTERYELTSHLARGGMADVYEGKDGLLGRRVAVKILHSQLSLDEAFVKRFRREAQAAANLTHPNIVGIYDWGQFDSTYFIVMELVEGRSLRDVLRSQGALLPRRAVEIAAEVAAALSVAHRAGLVHRDIKPGNILLATDGTVKVTDFGIARAWDDSQELTRTGAVMGTATYFSPEQAQGLPVDERSDIYSLGVVLYEMLTGQPPFRGDSPVSVAYQHVSTEVAAPSAINPDVPDNLDYIVRRAMHKDPAARYQTAEELRRDLWRALQGEGPAVVALIPGDGATRMMTATPPATVPPAGAYRQLEEAPSSNLGFVVGAFALLATLGVLVFLVLRALNGPGDEVGTLVPIPTVAGSQQESALRALQVLGLIAIPQPENSAEMEPGLAIRTDPVEGTEVERGSTVIVYVSAGEAVEVVPQLATLTRESAERLILDQGFMLGGVTTRGDPEVLEGIVISQNPLAGVEVPGGSAISIVVSSGPDAVPVPQIEGLPQAGALSELSQAGLNWDVVTEFSPDVEAGTVIRSEPEAGVEVEPASVVVVVVSDGPEPVTVPDLFGMTEDEARTAVEALGLTLRVSAATIPVQDPSLVGRVVEQNPEDGASLLPGNVVNVTLGAAPPTTTTTTAAPTTTTPPTTTPPTTIPP